MSRNLKKEKRQNQRYFYINCHVKDGLGVEITLLTKAKWCQLRIADKRNIPYSQLTSQIRKCIDNLVSSDMQYMVHFNLKNI